MLGIESDGEFTVVNKHLMSDLVEMGLWTPALKNELIHFNGSVQRADNIPDPLKSIYKTVWEIKQRTIVDMAADRGAFIDQSQSLNIHLENPNFGKLTSLHFYTWRKGMKTGMYYLRTRAAADAIQFTVDKSSFAKAAPLPKPIAVEQPSPPETPVSMPRRSADEVEAEKEAQMAALVCSLENKDACISCGS